MVSIEEIQAAYYMVAATGVLVAAAYYILNIRTNQKNQELTLEIRQADLIERYAGFVTSKEWVIAWTDVMWNQQFSSFEEWIEKYGHHNLEAYNNLLVLMGVMNSYGVLFERKLMDVETIEDLLQGLRILLAWDKIGPIVGGWRKLYNDPGFDMPFEHLAEEVARRNPQITLKKY